MSESSRIRYSLRSLLIVTTLAALLFAGLRSFGLEPFVALCWALGACIATVSFLLAMQRSVVHASQEDTASPHTVASVPSDFEAALIVDELACHGISARPVGGYTAGFRAESPGEIQIVVIQQDLARAQQVLAEFQPDKSDVDWSQVDIGEAEDA